MSESAFINALIAALLGGILSGSVISTLLAILLRRRGTQIEEEIRNQFSILRSRRTWKEQSIAELLGPINIQLDRTERGFQRWKSKNLFLEAKVIRGGNLAIRDCLLNRAHLIPPPLLDDAGRLIEHYDRWLEEYEKKRLAETPDLESSFVFVGPAGYPFPRQSAARFQETYQEFWEDLFGAPPEARTRRPN